MEEIQINDGFTITKNEKDIYESIEKDIGKYFSQNELLVFYDIYILLLSLIKQSKIDRAILLLQLQAVKFMTDLQFIPELILSYMLNYAYYVLDDSEKKIINYGSSISEKVVLLVKIEELLENNYGWFKQFSRINIASQNKFRDKKDKSKNWDEQTNDNIIKMYLQLTSSEPMVLIAILINRIYVLQNSKYLFNDEDTEKIAKDTLSVHSKIAEQMGVWTIKSRLDDTAFKILDPVSYKKIVVDLDQKREEREFLIRQAIAILAPILKENNISADISGRAKHIFGLYQKLKMDPSKSISDINDSLGIRIIVNTEEECFEVLSILQNKWVSVAGIYDEGYFRDWISHPKKNNYQSIHTTVYFHEYNNKLIEVQIRTKKMHEVAENGEAAHWVYKLEKKSTEMNFQNKKIAEEINKLRQQVKKYYPIS